ncbi:MAG: hypothetical protein IJM68_00680 [Synergistaceae bacterium]|nr:hypothetical protein [Synergistaceae bacterium]
MGSGGTKTTTVPTKGEMPEDLKNIRAKVYEKILPGIESYNADDWNTARQTANQALSQQQQLLSQIPNALNQGSNIANEIATLARTGNIPSGLANNLNTSVNQELQSSMGTMLNNLASRGVVNSSIMSQGVSDLSKQAADAYNRNYLTAYQTALTGMNSALQGQQKNLDAVTTGVYTLGKIPEQVYEGTAAQLMPAFNLWKAMQSSYDNTDTFDTIVSQESSSCITGDTRVRLWSGHEIPVSDLTGAHRLLAWDFDNGRPVIALLTAFFKRNGDKEYDVIRVKFEDGSSVGVVKEHLFFDLTEGKFVAINKDSQDFIGHEFAKINGAGKVIPVKVKDIFLDGTVTETYAPQTAWLNFVAEGFITGNDGQLGLCNRFDFDTNSMAYDMEKKGADLEKYGLLEYDEFKEIVSQAFFDSHRFEEFSVAFGKGLLDKEQFKAYLKELSDCFIV